MILLYTLLLGVAAVVHGDVSATTDSAVKFVRLNARAYLVAPFAGEVLSRLALDEARDPAGNSIQPVDHHRINGDVLKLIFGPVDDVRSDGGGRNWYNGIFSEFTYQVSFNFRMEQDWARMTCRTEFARGALTVGTCQLISYVIYFTRPFALASDTTRISLSQTRILKELAH